MLTALAEEWLNTARSMALEQPTERLDPPAVAVLDELPNATPLPGLPGIVSDSAGRGVIIHWAAQSVAQLEDCFTPTRARTLLDNTTTKSVWGGLSDQRTLEWVSTLFGYHDRERWQTHNEGWMTPGRSSVGTETVPTFHPGDIRTIPRNDVIIAHRTLRAIRGHTTDVTQRPDWPQLRADVAAIRAGTAPIDRSGHLTTAAPTVSAAAPDNSLYRPHPLPRRPEGGPGDHTRPQTPWPPR